MATDWQRYFITSKKKLTFWKTNNNYYNRKLLLKLLCKTYLWTIFVLDCFFVNTVEAISAGHENRILDEVIFKYSNNVRPSVRPNLPVNVTLDITFNNIIDVDEKHQILTTSIWVRQFWANSLTSWNESKYGGLKAVILDSNKVWQPDTILYNNVYAEYSGRLDVKKTRVRINQDGSTFWAAPFIFKTLCKINVADFPFDTQICSLTFGAWQYNGNEVNVVNNKKVAAIASTRVENGEWEVLKVLINRKVIYYQCCPNQPYPEISFVIHMKRRPLFYVVNLVLPNILISLLAFFSFFIPVECGERISFVITVLLSMTVFMLLVAESIPPTSDAVPVIGIYYTFSIFEVFLALLATGISLKINYSYMFGDGLSPKLRKILFNTVGPCIRFDVQDVLHRNATRAPSRETLSAFDRFVSGDDIPEMPETHIRPRNKDKVNGSYEGKNIFNDENWHTKEELGYHEETETELKIMASKIYKPQKCRIADDRNDHIKRVAESKLAAAIIDRLFLWIFIVIYLTSTVLIFALPVARSRS